MGSGVFYYEDYEGRLVPVEDFQSLSETPKPKFLRCYNNILLPLEDICFQGKTKFNEVVIGLHKEFGKILILNGQIQSAENLEFIYHESIVHLGAFYFDPNLHPIENVFIIGGGEGATLREVLKYKSLKNVVMCDIDEELIKICCQYLPSYNNNGKVFFNDSRVKLVFEDAFEYLLTTEDRYDLIIFDVTDPDENSSHLYSVEFFELVKERLQNFGRFTGHALSISRESTDKNHRLMYKNLEKVFDEVRIFTIPLLQPYYCNQPIFVVYKQSPNYNRYHHNLWINEVFCGVDLNYKGRNFHISAWGNIIRKHLNDTLKYLTPHTVRALMFYDEYQQSLYL